MKTPDYRLTDSLLPVRWTLGATSLGFVVVQLDVTIVNVAMPQIGRNLNTDMTGLQWLVDAYTLAFAALLLTAGSLGDYFGSKRVFCCGLALFGCASLVCAISPSAGVLIMARAVQGAGAALIQPTSLALLTYACRGNSEARHHAIGWWSAIGGVVSAAGPVVGGALTSYFTWRSIFFINLPVCLLGWLACRRYVSETDAPGTQRFDIAGQISGIVGVFFLTHAIIEGGAKGVMATPVMLSFVAAGASLLLFVLVERRATSPMLPLYLFRDRAFSAAILLGMIMNITFYGSIFVLSIYFQHVKGYSPTQAGFALLPFIIIMLANLISARLSARYSPVMTIVTGFALSALAFVMLHGVDESSSYLLRFLPALLLLALGAGIRPPALISLTIGCVEPQRSATASAALNAARQIGSAIGVALFGAWLVGTTGDIVSGVSDAFDLSAVLRFIGVPIAAIYLGTRRLK